MQVHSILTSVQLLICSLISDVSELLSRLVADADHRIRLRKAHARHAPAEGDTHMSMKGNAWAKCSGLEGAEIADYLLKHGER